MTLLLLACTSQLERGPVEVTLSEAIPTVATLRFTTLRSTETLLRFGPVDGPTTEVLSPTSREHELLLVGMRPQTRHAWQVVALDGDEEREIAHGTLLTGAAPASLTPLRPSGPDHQSRGFVVGSMVTFPAAAVIFDEEGVPVWWHEDGRDTFFSTRTRLSTDGRSVLYNAYDPSPEGPDADLTKEVVRVSLDGTQVQHIRTPEAHHDFVELPDGTIAYLAFDVRTPDGDDKPVKGDRIVELRPDGSQREAWSVWDDFEWSKDQLPEVANWWSHANALDYLPEEDAYLVSLRNFDAIVKVDRRSGELLWVLGEQGDFDLVGDGTFTHQQHQFQMLDGGILVFDNRTEEELASRVVEYALDEQTGTIEQVWSYQGDLDLYVFGLGSTQRLDTGATVVTWSTAGQIEEVDADGQLVWRLNADIGAGIGFTTWMEDLYPGPEELWAR